MKEKKLLGTGIKYPIKLEYYKTINTEDVINKEIYGIEIIKTEYITENEEQAEKILKIFKENEVTPVSAQYIIDDMLMQNI